MWCVLMFQMEFLAHKTEELGRQRTMKELQERKLVQLELQCDQLRAENNVSVNVLSGAYEGRRLE